MDRDRRQQQQRQQQHPTDTDNHPSPRRRQHDRDPSSAQSDSTTTEQPHRLRTRPDDRTTTPSGRRELESTSSAKDPMPSKDRIKDNNNSSTRQQPSDRNNNRHVATVPQTTSDSKPAPSEQRRGRTSKRYDEYVAQKMLAKSKLEEREVGPSSRTKTSAAATSRADAAKPIPSKDASRKDANNIRLRVATDVVVVRDAITNPDDDRSTTTTTPQRRRPRHDSNSSITEDAAEFNVNKRPPPAAAQAARTPTTGFSATTPKRVVDKNASSSNGRLELSSADLKSGQRSRRNNPAQTASDTESEGHASRSRRNVKKPEAAAVSATSISSRRPRDISDTREDKEHGSSTKDASNARIRQVTSPLTRREPRSNEKLVGTARSLKKGDTSDSSDGESAVAAAKLSKPKPSKSAAVNQPQSQSTDSLSENEAPKPAKDAKLSKSQRIQPIDSDDEIPIPSKLDPQQTPKKSSSRPYISDSSDEEAVKPTKPSKRQSNQSSNDDDSDHERIPKKNVVGTAKVETIVKSPASSKLLSKPAAAKPKVPETSDSSDSEDGHALVVDEPNLERASPVLARKVQQQPESIKVELVEQAVKSKQQQRRRDVSDSSDGEIEIAAPKPSKSKKKGTKEDVVVASKAPLSEMESKQQPSPEPPKQISENLEPKTDAKKSSKRQKDKTKQDDSQDSPKPLPRESSPPVPQQKPKIITKPTTTTTEPTRSKPATNFKKLSGKRRSCVIMIANPKLREIVKRRALATTKQHGRFELLKESSGSSEESKVDLDDDRVEEVDAWSDADQDVVVAATKTGGKNVRKSIVKPVGPVGESIGASQVSSSQPQEPKKKSSSSNSKKAVKQQSKANGSGKRGDLDFEKELYELELLEDKVSAAAAAADEIKKAKDVEKPKGKQIASNGVEAPARAVVEDLRQQHQSKKTDDDARVSSSSSASGSKRTKPETGSQNTKDLKDKKVSKYDADSASSSSSDESHHSSSFRTRGQRKLARKSSQESSSPVKRKNGSNNSRKIESSDDDDVKEDVAVKPAAVQSPTVPYRRKISSDTSDAETDIKPSPFSNKKVSSESLVSNNNNKARVPSPKRRSSMSGSSEDEIVISRKGTNASKQENAAASRIQNTPSASVKVADLGSGKVVEKKLVNRTSEQSTLSDSRPYQLPPRRTQYSDDSSDAEDHQNGRDDEKVGKSGANETRLQKPASNNNARIKSPQRRAVDDSSHEDEYRKKQSDGEKVVKSVAKDHHLQKPVSNNSRIKSPQRRTAVDDSSDEEQHQEKRREEKSGAIQKPASNNSRIKSPQRRAVDQSSSDEETFKSPKTAAAPILRKTTANSSKEAISSRDGPPPIRVHSPRRRDSLMSSDDEKSVSRQSSVKIPSRSGSMKRPSRSESLKRPDRSESLKRQAGRNDMERPGPRKNASRSRKTDDSSDEEQDRPTRKVTSPRTRRPPSGMSVHSEVSARRNRTEVKADTPSLISLAESRISIPSASPSPNMTDKPPKLRISQLSRVKNEYPDSDDSTATKEPIRKAPSPVVLSPKPSPRSSLTNPTPSPPTQKTGFFRSLWGGGGSKPAASATPSNQGSATSVAEVAPPTPLKEFESDKNPSMGRSIASSATSVSQSTTTSVPEKVETRPEVEGAPKKTVLGWIFGGKKPAAGGAQGAQVGDSKTSSDALEDTNSDVQRKSDNSASDSESGSEKSRRSTMRGLGIQRRRTASVSSQEKEKPKSARRYSDSSSEEETSDRRPGQSASQTRRGNPAGSNPQANAAGRPLRGGRPQESRALDKHPNESKSVRQDGNPTRRLVGRRAERPVDDLSDFSAVSD